MADPLPNPTVSTCVRRIGTFERRSVCPSVFVLVLCLSRAQALRKQKDIVENMPLQVRMSLACWLLPQCLAV